MAIVENIHSRILRRALIDLWYLTSRCNSCRQKNTLATFRNWKHRGLSFRLRIVVFSLQEHRPPRKQTKSRQIIRLRLTYFQRQCTNVRTSMRRQTTDCCFPSHIYSNLTYATALATPLSVGRMTTDATECFSITVFRAEKIYLSRSPTNIWHPVFM